MSNVPAELKYAKSHEWVRKNDDGSITVGISEHAQELLGDMVYVEVPEVGNSVEAEEACAVVESVKAASDIYSPVAGEVVEVNEALDGAPELINSSPYDEGWIMRLQPADMADVDALLDASAYETQISEE
ncbi:glycine cleavage system protein H [Solemya pervernicosa gill symbiont]|uniref:Glycine cleavage system H protein n=2 Tax=Gammaproteobacteria incertae sedis TaxID=118884 RepID=A0A1T2L303_9GAMM|nr:glycine cleavage system protein GcvH [Candidatus Reidiella endopervernicosa]OOZ39487.1 glycine cleavage system protein H [Solemya pervernicosa gill symbiont]QKQ25888.1 glycine cleavage system protein GcvH [Candidatus Reidiella endopervernicosa]